MWHHIARLELHDTSAVLDTLQDRTSGPTRATTPENNLQDRNTPRRYVRITVVKRLVVPGL